MDNTQNNPQRPADAKPPSADASQATILTSVPGVPATKERTPFREKGRDRRLIDPGTSRATVAASLESPNGTSASNWTARHQHQTVLQQHCSFFDPDHDNVIYPTDTYRGFHKLGFGVLLSLLAVFIIHPAFSYPSLNSCIPDPYFRVCLANIHKCKHGSDSGAYDTEGRFVPQRFEDMFVKYADGGNSLDIRQLWHLIRGQRVIFDPVGWFAVFFEWLAVYIMLWPGDGKLSKESLRRVYDGSIFYTIAARRARNETGDRGE